VDITSSHDPNLTLRLIHFALAASDTGQYCSDVLPVFLEWMGSDYGFVMASDPRLPAENIAHHHVPSSAVTDIEEHLRDWLDQLSDASDSVPFSIRVGGTDMSLLPLCVNERLLGMIGWHTMDVAVRPDCFAVVASLGLALDCLAAKASLERKLLHFTTFLEIGSLLSKPVGLSDSLEIALFSSMKAVSAEAASVLLLDEAKERFHFFHVEGTAKPLLGETTFESSHGVAGRVLRSLEAEVVNNVADDDQFYGRIDEETGFRTRNLIAVPLLAGRDPIGVLEVLNRTDHEDFTADDRLLLSSIADQIAYAIRNAQTFDRVVDVYCHRRQGADSCGDCPQPIESWAPCINYRERFS